MTYDGDAQSVSFSPDGKYVVSGSWDNTVSAWDVTTGKEVAFMIHDVRISSSAFSPDGKYEVLGGCDQFDISDFCIQGVARVRDTTTGKEISRMTYDTVVVAVAFSPDGKYVVSIGGTTARVWIYRPIDLIAESCSRVTRNLTCVEWKQYIGDALPYQAICPNLPIEAESTPVP